MKAFIDRLRALIRPSGEFAARPPDTSRYLDLEGGARGFECSLAALEHSDACADLFLNRYTVGEIKEIMERTGLAAHLDSLSLPPLRLEIARDESRIHRFGVYCGASKASRLLIDLRLSEIVYRPGEKLLRRITGQDSFPMIAIEWLNLQNPFCRFTAERPRLPGQEHPGLGAVSYIFKMLEIFARDMNADGIMDVPESFHAAAMYSRSFRFVDPRHEGMLRALLRDLGDLALHELAWGFVCGAVIEETSGGPAVYEPAEQVFPVSDTLERYFASKQYGERVADEERARRYRFDRDWLARIKKPTR